MNNINLQASAGQGLGGANLVEMKKEELRDVEGGGIECTTSSTDCGGTWTLCWDNVNLCIDSFTFTCSDGYFHDFY